MQTAGMGGLRPNTVVLGWPYGWRHQTDAKAHRVFLESVRNTSNNKMALLVPKGINFFPTNNEKVRSAEPDRPNDCLSHPSAVKPLSLVLDLAQGCPT